MLPNLTRNEAPERAALVTVDNYRIELDLTGPSDKAFRSRTTVEFEALPGADTYIDLAAHAVHRAVLNGHPIDVSGYDESRGIELRGCAQNNVLVVEADCYYSNTGEGLHRFVDPVDGEVYLYSQFETADAKRMFACFDQPDLKATFDVVVTAPAHWQVISNGATLAADRDGDVTTHLLHHPEDEHHLVALVAGPYAVWRDVYRDRHGDIPLGIFCRASLAEHMDAERLFTETKQGFDFYHRNFGVPYAFGKYDQLFVPEFNAGAMENAGAVTFLEDYVFPLQGHPVQLRAPRRDGAARDGAHVVRGPGDHAVVGRPVAQRVVRDFRLGSVRPGHRVHRGVDHLANVEKSWPIGRTSCRPPIRWPPTFPTCTRSR